MKRTKQNFNVFIVIFLLCTLVTNAQQFDLLIKNGHVIDAKNGLDKMMDVAIKDGKIVKVETGIPVNGAMTVIDAKGLYVTPGLIDIHTHNFYGTQPDSYLSDGFSALPPDGFTFEHGVTTVVDAGGAGWRNFRLFKEQVIDRSKTRVLAFLNIVGSGMKGGAIEQNIADMDGRLTAIVAKRYPDLVVGVVQVVVKHMLSGEQLIAAIFKLITRVFKTVGVVTTGINIVLAEVIAGAHLVGHREFLALLV